MTKAETRKGSPPLLISRRSFLLAGALSGAAFLYPWNAEPTAEALASDINTPAVNPGLTTYENGEFALNEWSISQLREAGSRSLRLEMGLRGHAAEGWSDNLLYDYEKLMMSAAANGMEVAIQVGQGTIYPHDTSDEREAWNRNSVENGGGGRNDYMSELVATTAAMVAKKGYRFNRVEVWNEPLFDLQPSIMAGLMNDMYIAIKNVNPNMGVVYGGYMLTEPDYYLTAVIKYGNANFGWNGHLPWDYIGAHGYMGDASDGTLGYYLSHVQTLMGQHKPLRITEIGWQSDGTEIGELRQADNLKRLYQYIAKHPELDIRETNWFSYMDCWDGGVFKQYGLLDQYGKHKPAYAAFQQYAAGIQPSI